jgi:hypothetical protein
MNNMPLPYKGGYTDKVAVPSTESIRQASGVHGRVLNYKKEQSSLVGQARQGGLSSNNFDRIYPRIEFWKREEFYLTVGRVQNVVESYVLNIINRSWFYDGGKDVENEGEMEEYVKLMEKWEEDVMATKLLSTLVRNWIIYGTNIISPTDWEFVQLQSIQAKRRDMYGKTTEYIQIINGREVDLKADKFIELSFIELDREPWGIGMFDSLMNNQYLDVDGRTPRASLELYRQALQDNMKIHHKFASPRVLYIAENANEETVDNDIVPVVEGMMPGDRAVFNTKIEISQETIDGTGRFVEYVNKIVDEIDTGLQSSANRVIAEPSAMADAGEAGSKDDDRTLGMMERVRIFMNREVIPRVTGLEPGKLVFKWGAKDQFDLEFPVPIKEAIQSGIISPRQAQLILEEQYHWKIPTVEEVDKKLGPEIIKEDPNQNPNQNTKAEPPIDKSGDDMDKKIKNEKLIAYKSFNEIIDKEKQK